MKYRCMRSFGSLFTLLVLVAGLLPMQAAAQPLQGLYMSFARPQASCSSTPTDAPSGMTSIDGGDFCVYYNSSDVTTTQANTAVTHIQNYWNRYVTDFGFRAPKFSGKLVVILTTDTGCNGGTSFSSNKLDAFTGCYNVAQDIQVVLGHELFHRIQYSYGDEVKWFKEGTARAVQDNVFADIDNWSGALGQSFSFNSEANNYLAATNNDMTSIPMRYQSSLWWKYFMEQYGSTTTEPQRGIDALRQLWESADGADDIAAVNNALAALGAGVNFDTAFKRFTVANITKDLTGLPDGSYSYIDEKEAGNPAVYGPIVPQNGGTINTGTPATFNNQSVTRYGARYYSATPAASCPVITASFHRDDSGPAFYHVVTQKGSAFARHVEGSGADWSQSFINDGITRVTAVAGSTNNSSQVDVTLSCANPVIDIKQPNSGAVAFAGPFSTPGKFLAQVLVTNGSPTSPVVAGLTVNDFKARVNGVEGLVTAGGFIQEQYWLVIDAPVQSADGVYDLEVTLEAPGTTTPVATDTNTASVRYTNDHLDHVLVIDRSGSMSEANKMPAAQAAANFYVDITRNSDGVAVVPYNQDINPAPFAMQSSNLTVRNNAKSYINGLTPSGATSIGDGMQGAVTQRAGSPTGNPRCSFVLMSDGMENSAAFWSDVKAAVQGTGCPVTSIAFGPASSETLMQQIATDTGGAFFYNDVYVSSNTASADAVGTSDDTALGLDNTYEYAQARAENRQRLLQQQSSVPTFQDQTHTVQVDPSVKEGLFALTWANTAFTGILSLRDPDGNVITSASLPYTFADYNSGHVGWRIPNPKPGAWQMIVRFEFPIIGGQPHVQPQQSPNVPYQVITSGPSDISVDLLLPDKLNAQFFTGNRVPIRAFVSGTTPIANLPVQAIVTAPDGTQTTLALLDDGQHDDGIAGDGLYANWYTRVNQANAVTPTGEVGSPKPQNEGAYRVRVLARSATFQREALGSFAVLAGADANTNGLPDTFEAENNVTDPGGDPDLDGLNNQDEYLAGTDPNNSDSDGGGENDGSEIALHSQNPLDAKDDQIARPEFLRAEPENGKVHLLYDVKAEYTRMLLYRSDAANGPWALRNSELPLTGAYDDAATNGQPVFYKLIAIDADNHRSAVVSSEAAKPSTDPVPPEARVLVNNDAPKTTQLNVALSFAPYDQEAGDPNSFGDITQMLLSNDPSFDGAQWQPFAQNVPWTLAGVPSGSAARVYARFRDAAGNESVTMVGSIIFEPGGTGSGRGIYLPLIVR